MLSQTIRLASWMEGEAAVCMALGQNGGSAICDPNAPQPTVTLLSRNVNKYPLSGCRLL
jgi:hypothetical protein